MMEEPREQPPAQQQPAYHQAAPGYQEAARPSQGHIPPIQTSAVDTASRVVRLLAARAVWAGGQGWRLIEPRLGWVLLTGFLFGVIGLLGLLLLVPPLLAGRGEPTDARVAALPPAQAVENFLRGQQTYDADLMWDSFSTELRESLEGREITRDALAERVESERLAGRRYSGFKYIGGVELGNRQTMYFYAVEIASPEERGTVSFVFTVGGDGKIVSVD